MDTVPKQKEQTMSKKPEKKPAPKKPTKEKDQLTDEQLDDASGAGQPPPGDLPIWSPKLPTP
jgi:hypothetical protein